VRNKREVPAHIPKYKGRGGFRSAPYEFGKFLTGDVTLRHGPIPLI
jgi:hypothetical protein